MQNQSSQEKIQEACNMAMLSPPIVGKNSITPEAIEQVLDTALMLPPYKHIDRDELRRKLLLRITVDLSTPILPESEPEN